MIPETHKDLLTSKALAHVATIGPKGEPQTNPVWFDWDGRNVLFSQTKTRQKYQNVNSATRGSRCPSSIRPIPTATSRSAGWSRRSRRTRRTPSSTSWP